MEDFGNIVYIVAAIAWFAWNSYKKAQEGKAKPKRTSSAPAPNMQEAETSDPKTFEELIMEQFGQKQTDADEPVYTSPSNRPTSRPQVATPASAYQMSAGEMGSHRIERKKRKKVQEDEPEQSAIDEILPEGFSLKQAVVLNAILERPYN